MEHTREEMVKHLMHHYEEALEEMMDAQNYMKMIGKAHTAEDKNMYRSLSKQELDHGMAIMKSAERMLSEVESNDPLHMVWHYLKQQLTNWRLDIERKLAEM